MTTQTLWKVSLVLGALGLLVSLVLLGVLLSGCGSAPPLPPTEQACFDDALIGENCYTCASEPVCLWRASPRAEARGCYPRTQLIDVGEGESLVRISDLCGELPEGLDRP